MAMPLQTIDFDTPFSEDEPAAWRRDPAYASHFIRAYDGAHGHGAPCSAEQWPVIRPSFTLALAPLWHFSARNARRYATAYTRLAAWALERGLPMAVETLLSAEVTEAFLAQQPVGAADLRKNLRKLALVHGIEEAGTPIGYKKRAAPAPYSEAECEALMAFAAGMANVNRRVSLQALLALGLGCGLARTGLRGVSAASLHLHGDEEYLRSGLHCAKVREEYRDVLAEVCEARPDGGLLGEPRRDITTRIVSWVSGRVGVPHLSPDRLRSTYICRNLEEGATLMDIVAWTGVRRTASIATYFEYVTLTPRACPAEPWGRAGAL